MAKYYVGERLIEGPDGIPVIDDEGREVMVPRGDFWQYEQDSRQDGITLEEFLAMEGEE